MYLFILINSLRKRNAITIPAISNLVWFRIVSNKRCYFKGYTRTARLIVQSGIFSKLSRTKEIGKRSQTEGTFNTSQCCHTQLLTCNYHSIRLLKRNVNNITLLCRGCLRKLLRSLIKGLTAIRLSGETSIH